MKARKILTLPLLLLVVALAGSCKKATSFYDALYFTGTEQSPEKKFTIDGPSSIGVSVTSSTKLDKDLVIQIEVDAEKLTQYNQENGTAYQFLPNGSYDLETGQVQIQTGSNVSGSSRFSVLSLDNFEEGVTYCVPISIKEVSGGMKVLESSRTVYLIINRTIITQAVALAPNYFRVPAFQNDASLSSIPRLSMECRVYVNQFQTANPFISSVMGIEENFLLRFGDVSIANNQLQLAGGLINSKKYPVNSKAFFSTGQWYHVAIVYNGSTMSLYVDGVLDNYTDAESGGINLTDSYSNGFHIGYSAGGRTLNGYVSEARVWTKALTAKEIQNNLCYVDPTTPELLAYWRFNEQDTDGNIPDLTGHGFPAVPNRTVNWISDVRCPD